MLDKLNNSEVENELALSLDFCRNVVNFEGTTQFKEVDPASCREL